MSYSSVVEMANSQSLIGRMIAAAAQQSIPDPEVWARVNVWKLVSSPGWDTKWSYARDEYNPNQNPDFGARTDVIADSDILAAVQAAKAAEAAPQP